MNPLESDRPLSFPLSDWYAETECWAAAGSYYCMWTSYSETFFDTHGKELTFIFRSQSKMDAILATIIPNIFSCLRDIKFRNITLWDVSSGSWLQVFNTEQAEVIMPNIMILLSDAR